MLSTLQNIYYNIASTKKICMQMEAILSKSNLVHRQLVSLFPGQVVFQSAAAV